MATHQDFKNIANNRLKTVELLMINQEWGIAAYLLGFVLECTLKAAACKSLNLPKYPELGKGTRSEISTYFRTHNFDMLLVVSGTTDIFSFSGIGSSSWSGFTQEYSKVGQWTTLRYETLEQFDEQKVRALYDFLTNEKDGIIPLMDKEKRW